MRSDVRLAGPGVLMFGIASALRDRGWTVEVAVGSETLIERFTDAGFRVHVLPGLDLDDRSPVQMARGSAALRRIARETGVSVIHSFNAQAGLLAWVGTLGLPVRVINTVLGAGKESLLKLMPFQLIAVSDFVKNDLVRHKVPARRITTVYNGVITPEQTLAVDSEFDAVWDARRADEVFRIVSIAMMNGDKGHRAAIEVFARLVQQRPEQQLELVLVGDGTLRPNLERFAREQGVDRKVRFAGALTNVFPELDRAHAFLHLSPQETFGIVLAEAHARGLPAVSFSIGGVPEVVADGETGILAPLGELDHVVAALTRLIDDRDLCQTFGRAGLDRVRKLFMRDALGRNIEAAYVST